MPHMGKDNMLVYWECLNLCVFSFQGEKIKIVLAFLEYKFNSKLTLYRYNTIKN